MAEPESTEQRHEAHPEREELFPPTQWTTIFRAAGQDPDEENTRQALERFCERYRQPLVRFMQRFRQLPDEPDDLLNGFLLSFLRRERLARVHPSKGTFRSYLVRSLTNFINNKWAEARAEKRNRGRETQELTDDIPSAAQIEDATRELDRGIAVMVVEQALERWERSCARRRSVVPVSEIKPYLTMENPGEKLTEMAARLGVQENTVHKAHSEMRKAFARALLYEVERIVGPGDDPKQELSYLWSVYTSRQ